MQGPEVAVLGNAIDSINAKAKDIRKALEDFLHKLEHEQGTLVWPSVLDNFALLSGQISSLLSAIKSEKTPPLRNYPLVPLRLCQDPDPQLLRLTEGRVSLMSHAEVPDYLRTKPDPEIEQAERQLAAAMATHSEQASLSSGQVLMFNKQCNKVLEKIKSSKMNWKGETPTRASAATASNPRATQELFAAVYYGKGVKMVGNIPSGSIATSTQP